MLTEVSINIFGQNGVGETKGSLSDIKINYNNNYINISSMSTSEGNTSLKFFYKINILNSNLETDGCLVLL